MFHQAIYNRLRRIEGQIRGIEEMIAKEKPEKDILIQLSAARSSLISATNTLIGAMLKEEPDGKVLISNDELKTILQVLK
jgi:CsoR family transcriptional regulator, copper-sensing transcriptional repressor